MADAPNDDARDGDDASAAHGSDDVHATVGDAPRSIAANVARIGAGVAVVGTLMQLAAHLFPQTTGALAQSVTQTAASYVAPAVIQATEDVGEAVEAQVSSLGASRETSATVGRGVRHAIQHVTGCKDDAAVLHRRRREPDDDSAPKRLRLTDRM